MRDHHPDARTGLVGAGTETGICTDAAACALVARIFLTNSARPREADRAPGLRSTLGWWPPKAGLLAATSDTHPILFLGLTLRAPEGGQGLSHTHTFSMSWCA